MAFLSPPWRRRLAALLMGLACLGAQAQDDPPGRVGRLADLEGQVWLYDLETGDWVAAVRNRPLTTGDRVSTDANARAELRVGSSTLRVGGGTEIEVLQLDDDFVRVQLHAGLLALRLRTHEAAREFELVTPEGRFKPELAGRYRLDRIDATSSVTVWSGQLLFEAADNATTVVAGQRADILLSLGRTQYTLGQAARDAFSDEVAASEAASERSVSAKYVSPEMTGAEELDGNGRWENDAEYGALWVPRAVVPGWAPYRFGHWAWVRPWGWTWVDDARWGFAPFHYGRWVFLRNAWCWAPGRWVARPVYAPALVAWVGAPLAGVSISVNVGPSVGWFPLAPREVFVPPYRVSPHYVRNVNVTHVTNITNVTTIINSPNTVVQQTHYVNRGVPGAMTVVPTAVVSGRQPVAPARVHLTDPRPGAGGDRRTTMAAQAPVTAAAPVPVPPRARPAVTPAPAAPAVPPARPVASVQAAPVILPPPSKAAPPAPIAPRPMPATRPQAEVAQPVPAASPPPGPPHAAQPALPPAGPNAQAVPAASPRSRPPHAAQPVPQPPVGPNVQAVPAPAAAAPVPAASPRPRPPHAAQPVSQPPVGPNVQASPAPAVAARPPPAPAPAVPVVPAAPQGNQPQVQALPAKVRPPATPIPPARPANDEPRERENPKVDRR